MDARRRSTARLRRTACDLRDIVEARSPARANRLFMSVLCHAGNEGWLAAVIQEIDMELEAGMAGPGDNALPLCIKDALSDLLALADAIAALAARAAAEGPAARAPPAGRDAANEWLDAWSHQLDVAVTSCNAMLRSALPHCGGEAQGRMLAAAGAALRASGDASLALLTCGVSPVRKDMIGGFFVRKFETLVDEWIGQQCELAEAALRVCRLGSGVPAAAEAAAAGALAPPVLMAWLRPVTAGLDMLVERLGLRSCTCVVQLCKMLAALLEQGEERLVPHARVFFEEGLAEGCIEFLKACHSALLEAPGWEEDEAEARDFEHDRGDWGATHTALTSHWVLAWRGLLWHAERAGRQQAVLAQLAAAAGTMLAGEARLLASLPLQLPAEAAQQAARSEEQREQQELQRQSRVRLLRNYWASSLSTIGLLGGFLLRPAESLPQAGPARAWKVFQHLSAAAPHVLRCWNGGQPATSQPQLVVAANEYLGTCLALCWHTTSLEQQREAPPEHAASAALLASSLVRLARLLPLLNPPASSAFERAASQGLDGRLLIMAVQEWLRATASLLEGQRARPTSSLARLHSSACSLAHAIAALDKPALDACFPTLRASISRWFDLNSSKLEETPEHPCAALAAIPAGTAGLLLLPALAERRAAGGDGWQRQYVCCLLEATAALAAVEQRACRDSAEPEQQGGLARRRVMRGLQWLATRAAPLAPEQAEATAAAAPAAAAGGGAEDGAEGDEGGDEEGGLDESAVLAELAAPLPEPAAALLPPLLARLLPPQEPAAAEGPLAGAAPGGVSAEAAALQAEALATRRGCTYLRCPNLAGPQVGEARTKACALCRQARYDCRECQKADWRQFHQAVCRQSSAS